MTIISKPLVNENILIIGGTGSLGRALIEKLSGSNELHIISRDEAKHWTLKNYLDSKSVNVTFHVGDIRDKYRISELLTSLSPSIVIIAAALKQVDTCEKYPSESIQTNLIGIQNVCNAVQDNSLKLSKLKTVLLVSTDKACAPTNVYGMCKAISERVVTSQPTNSTSAKFVAVRYGNVLESRGSIIPLFKYQVENSDYLTVTDVNMTRFSMTLDQSINFIEETILNARSGEILIPKIPAMRISDLAEIFAERFKKEVRITGIRPGEKLHEDLVSEPESIRTRQNDYHYIIMPPLNAELESENFFSYSSNDKVMTKKELSEYLEELSIFEMKMQDFIGREIEEIRK